MGEHKLPPPKGGRRPNPTTPRLKRKQAVNLGKFTSKGLPDSGGLTIRNGRMEIGSHLPRVGRGHRS